MNDLSLNYTPSNDIYFSKVFFINQNYITSSQIIAFSKYSHCIYIYNITDVVNENLTISFYTKIENFNFNIEDISQGGFFNEYLILSFYTSGILFFQGDDWNIKYNYSNVFINEENIILNIKDLVFNNSTMYLIIDGIGMCIYDFTIMNFIDYVFIHPYLVKFDSMANFENYYVGIAVDNRPDENIPEVFIELIADIENELNPKLNKVFTSHFDINIHDIASDSLLGFSYLVDRNNNFLIILTRAVPNILESFNYKIDLSRYNLTIDNRYINESTKLLSELGPYSPSLYILAKNESIVFGKFKLPNIILTCDFISEGLYTFNFNSKYLCSFLGNNTNNKEYMACPKNYTYKALAQGRNYIPPYGYALICLFCVIIIGLIIYLIYKYKKKKPKKEISKQYIPTSREIATNDNNAIGMNDNNAIETQESKR